MQKYLGQEAKLYRHTLAKKITLIPALERAIPIAKNGKLIDLGCGGGSFCETAKAKGYEYYGIDTSPDMIARAKTEFPQGVYQQVSATKFSQTYDFKFDVVVINMLFLDMDKESDILDILKEAALSIKDDGVIVVGVTHPCFDSYMRKSLFRQHDVETDFQGYFHSGALYSVYKDFGDYTFPFENYHWTLADYLNKIDQAGLHLVRADECEPTRINTKVNEEYHMNRNDFPTYLVLSLSKR